MNKSQVIIAIDGSRAFLKRRTGIEEYAYQVIKHLRNELQEVSVIVYIRADQDIDFELPSNWRVKKLWAPRFWTQIRLSLEMLLHRPDVLFVPAHTVPVIHPKNTIVVIHGLEYEFCPRAYSRWSRFSMRAAIRFSCRVAETIICVSENTKKDVRRLYGTSSEKMQVIYEGYQIISNKQLTINGEQLLYSNQQVTNNSELQESCHPEPRLHRYAKHFGQVVSGSRENTADFIKDEMLKQVQHDTNPYILFIGRLEERKNIIRFIQAFEMAKEKYKLPQKLVLVGKSGYGYAHIRDKIEESTYKKDIVESGYVSEKEKWSLLKNADVFFFATLYEGFGIPVLEAQSMNVPVITSNVSSLPEVAGDGALRVNPESVEEIADAMQSLISNQTLKSAILQKGLENVKRFSWEKCAQEIGILLKE
jgi:glycosyltransferase involved in cell wall biosynthesis